jgi:hypothetical protein
VNRSGLSMVPSMWQNTRSRSVQPAPISSRSAACRFRRTFLEGTRESRHCAVAPQSIPPRRSPVVARPAPQPRQKVRQSGAHATAQCPNHEDRQASLAIYNKPGKAKVVCFAQCSDVLDVLPAIGMSVADLYDERRSASYKPDPEMQSRIEASRSITPPQRVLDDLLQLPDLGERLWLAAARIRPELYIWERKQLGGEPIWEREQLGGEPA